MPVIRSADAAVHQVHGSTFSSFVAPSRGSAQLCAWQLNVPAGLRGVAHRPTREEVLLLLDGELTVALDGIATVLAAILAARPARLDDEPTGLPPEFGALRWFRLPQACLQGRSARTVEIG